MLSNSGMDSWKYWLKYWMTKGIQQAATRPCPKKVQFLRLHCSNISRGLESPFGFKNLLKQPFSTLRSARRPCCLIKAAIFSVSRQSYADMLRCTRFVRKKEINSGFMDRRSIPFVTRIICE